MNTFARVGLLVAIWLLAWGEVTVANVITGVVLAVALLVAFPRRRSAAPEGSRVRPLALMRLVAFVLADLVISNVLVARQILSRRADIRTGVIEHEVHSPSDMVLTLIANLIALSPGTMTVEATRDPPVVHVHFLLLDDVDKAHQMIARLEHLIVAAIGPGEAS